MDPDGENIDPMGDSTRNNIEQAIVQGLEKDFTPKGDMPIIQEILEVKDLINHI